MFASKISYNSHQQSALLLLLNLSSGTTVLYHYLMQRVDISNLKNKKTALVLSGGVVKAAAWHTGVALALEELGFTFKNNKTSSNNSDLEISTYIGSSAGALISLYFAAGLQPLQIVDSFLNRKNSLVQPISYSDILTLGRPMKRPKKPTLFDPLDGIPFLLRKTLSPILNFSGLFTTAGLNEYITNHILTSNDFKDYEADLFIIATQLDHSRKVIFSKYNYPNPGHDSTSVYYTYIPISEAASASMSVPPFYSPHPVKNPFTGNIDYYIDGEIRETLSTHVAIDNDAEFIISSWTHTPYHYHDEVGSLIHYGLPAICIQAIHLMIEKKIVVARAKRQTAHDIITTVNDYMRANKFPNVHRKRLASILERKLSYKKNVHFIDIFPKHDNYKIFFQNSFSLNSKKMSKLVAMGHKRTMEVFKHHEWES
jgi:predicted acylesterase/phospholipase RssA